MSVESTVLLAARATLEDNLVTEILEIFFDHLPALSAGSSRVQDIRIESGFQVSGVVPLHPAAMEFKDDALDVLLIATGNLKGRYHTLGQGIGEVLAREDEPSRILHTDGSLENLVLLGSGRPTLAIVRPS